MKQYFEDCTLENRLLHLLMSRSASGYDVAKKIAEPGVTVSALYRTLHRLERRRLLRSEWRPVTGHGFHARHYAITPRGRRRLDPHAATGGVRVTLSPLTMLLMVAVAGATEGVAHPRPSGPRLTIVLDPRVPMPLDEIRLMQMGVMRIMGAIGVETDWQIETPARGQPTASQVPGFVIRIVITARGSPRSSNEWLLGFTPVVEVGRPAEVQLFRDNIVTFADAQAMEPSAVMAVVAAHELGHVLLPAPAHGTTGIMQSPWDAQTVEQARHQMLKFTAVQGQMVRRRLTLCCQIASKN